jgi:UMF1 family MFS transporter
MNKTQYRLWLLYDFANSLALVNVSFYFSLWLVSDHGMSDFWVSIAMALSTIMLFLVLPFFGGLSDRLGKRVPFLRLFSLLAIFSLGLLGWLTLNVPFTREVGFSVVLLFFFFQFFFQGALAFYNAFIRDFAQGKNLEKISGMGMGLGQLGNIVGILIVLPLAEGSFHFLGGTGREATFLFAAVLFLICALPVFLFLKDKPMHSPMERGTHFFSGIKKAVKVPGLIPYLISYYLFADAILTLQLFLGLYLQEVAGMDDRQKAFTLLVALIFGCLGALFSPRLSRLFKGTHRTLAFLIGFWALLLAALSLVHVVWLFYLLIVFNGMAYGALFSLSRSYYAELIPEENQAELFSLYVLFERAASVLGPLVWSMTILGFASYGPTRYRFAMFSLAILVGISFCIFKFVKKPSSS